MAQVEDALSEPSDRAVARTGSVGRVRWTICALVFFAMTVNYLDRQVYSIMVPYFEDDLKLGPVDLAVLNVGFILPYGLVMIFVGRFIDRVGLKRGLATTYTLWNVAMVGHALIRSLTGFLGVRLLLGVGESGMYPSAVKTMTEWFPVRERSLAMGIFNAAANCGALLAPIVGVLIADTYGWRACFESIGIVGFIWLFFWRRLYRSPSEHPKLTPAEFAYIKQDPADTAPEIGYPQLFAMRPVYALALGKALSDAPFWIYLTWLPKFLTDQFHVTHKFQMWSIAFIYIVADITSVLGGLASSRLVQRGWPVGPARKSVMLVCALLIVPSVSLGFLVDHPPIWGISCVYWTIGIVALVAGAHQGFSTNLFTMISDTVPRKAIALATGAINGFAMIGVSAMQLFVGRTVQMTSSYTIPFVIAGLLYLVALGVIQLIMPKVEPVVVGRPAKMPFVFVGAGIILAGIAAMQFAVNVPPYLSLNDYLKLRPAQLHAVGAPQPGPSAKVGWMAAEWFRWPLADGGTKYELVKFDTHAHPFVEEKGARAARYAGPASADLPSRFGKQ